MGKKLRIGGLTIKQTCCESKKRCGSCPVRLLKEGRLPPGYAVHHRRLVTLEDKAQTKAKTEGRAKPKTKKSKVKEGKKPA